MLCYIGKAMKYLEGLNLNQREAVVTTEGPLLIVAGAGAGKTKTLTSRIFHLLKLGVPPESILAITFTNKAAGELKERIKNLIVGDRDLNLPISWHEQPFAGTFHALCVQILRSMGRAIGLSPRFVIFDRTDAKQTMKEAVEQAGLDPKRFKPEFFLAMISRAKAKSLDQKRYEELISEKIEEAVAMVWRYYDQLLREANALDFDDLLLKAVELLKNNEAARRQLQETWRYIHVDEYQDTNFVQYELLRILSEKHRNICVVGDADQTIFSWRGASIRNILNFEKDFKGAKVIFLEQNYRSTKTILAAANEIIVKNRLRIPKNLFTGNDWGEKIGVFLAADEEAEANFVANKAKQLIINGATPDAIAVLYRANFQSRVLEAAFLEAGVPYQIIGTRFFERKEVKDALAYLRLARNLESRADLKRALFSPPRGIGKTTLLKIFAGAQDSLPKKIKEKYDKFQSLINRIGEAAIVLKTSEAVKFAISESGIADYLKNSGDEGLERLENVRELVTLALRYDIYPPPEGLDRLLTDATLASDQDDLSKQVTGVKLMTVHAAKGLEFDTVFIVGLEDGLFPHERLEEDFSEESSEEERRLFYVALTRARRKAILSYANARTIFGSRRFGAPSEFLIDLDASLLEEENPPSDSLTRVDFSPPGVNLTDK
jgi:DNA helicase-2/ATP-dependent DNA helicase PcrA